VKLRAPELVRPVGVIHRKRKKLSRAAQAFVELLLEQSPVDKEQSRMEEPIVV
jgi:DNA-binding transcriptional LysR family regulator